MDKYLQMCDYIELHIEETSDPDIVRKIIREYRASINGIGKPISEKRWLRTPSEKECYQLSISSRFWRLIALTKDYEVYRSIYGKPYRSENTDEVWNKRVIGKMFKKDGDFDSVDVSFYYSHFQNNDDVVRNNIAVMKENALKKVYEKLSKHYDISFNFLEVRKCVYRKNFDEVIVTIGLRKDIMDLKERIEQGVI